MSFRFLVCSSIHLSRLSFSAAMIVSFSFFFSASWLSLNCFNFFSYLSALSLISVVRDWHFSDSFELDSISWSMNPVWRVIFCSKLLFSSCKRRFVSRSYIHANVPSSMLQSVFLILYLRRKNDRLERTQNFMKLTIGFLMITCINKLFT